MKQNICYFTFLVKDYDEAIDFFTNKLPFDLIENSKLSETKRWVLVSPKGSSNNSILLAKASTREQENCIGNQTGGRVALFLQTDNFDRDFSTYKENGIVFIENPRTEDYAKVAVFKDLYGNRWDLLEFEKAR